MNYKDKDNYLININDAFIKLFIKDIAPDTSLEHLKDLFNVLIDALKKGKLDITLSKEKPSIEIKATGWPKEHQKALLLSGLLKGDAAPFILEDNKLSWRRWHDEMNQIVDELLLRNNSYQVIHPQAKVKKEILNKTLNKEQLSAINAISSHGIILVSGGPGTGKTCTIVQMLIEALNINPEIKIGLAAPTGKAARRLRDTLLNNINSTQQAYKNKLMSIPCSTLHSWLQARPRGFGKNKNSQLQLDLVVVDEMSMVDLSLMKALLDALPRRTQLVLVGDPNQLPPVGCGAVWEKLQTHDVLKEFGKGAVHLHKLYRNRGKIASLGRVIKEEGLESFWIKVLELESSSNVVIKQADSLFIPQDVILHLKKHKQELKELAKRFELEISNQKGKVRVHNKIMSETTKNLFDCLDRLMVLCPQKQGAWGVKNLHRVLLKQTFEEGIMNWPIGTPVMCLENQAELGLSNGDIGVAIGSNQNRKVLFKPLSSEQQSEISLIHPARIKKFSPAFALTIHKAQGSEANRVILLWPNSIRNNLKPISQLEPNEEFEKRLIYTAITRAKENLDIIINMDLR